MTPDLLRAIGVALYGEQWQSALARQLGVSSRFVRYLDAGDKPIPEGFRAELDELLRVRQGILNSLLAQLR